MATQICQSCRLSSLETECCSPTPHSGLDSFQTMTRKEPIRDEDEVPNGGCYGCNGCGGSWGLWSGTMRTALCLPAANERQFWSLRRIDQTCFIFPVPSCAINRPSRISGKAIIMASVMSSPKTETPNTLTNITPIYALGARNIGPFRRIR